MNRQSPLAGFVRFAFVGLASWTGITLAPMKFAPAARAENRETPQAAKPQPRRAPPTKEPQAPPAALEVAETTAPQAPAQAEAVCPILPAATSSRVDARCREKLQAFLEENGLCSPGSAQALVASIPEPLESRLNDQTDQALSAVLLSAEKNAGPFVDAWLPWIQDKPADSEDATAARAPAQAAGCHDFWPGIMLVAKYDVAGARSALATLVTGELPTAGSRRVVVQRAAEMAAALNNDAQVRFVGPVFSGSAGPLREALLDLIQRHEGGTRIDGAQIWSGSATNPQVAELLNFEEKLTFKATVAPDPAVLQTVYGFLVDHGFTEPPDKGSSRSKESQLLPHVAILREAETSYGQGFGKGGQETSPGAEKKPPKKQPQYRARYEILFPLHISEVRSAWEKESTALRTREKQPVPMPEQAVSVDLQEQVSGARDALPTFSSIACAYDERALTSALATLRDNHVDTVGIFATDMRDRLFLAEAIHRSAPDAQLFMLESDILLGHPDYAEALRGTIVASTYPLVTTNQFWSGRIAAGEQHERRQFASSIAEGIYNATSFAIADLRKGNACSSLYEYSWPLFGGQRPDRLEAAKPPLWLTIVGPNALWPLAALDVDDGGYMAPGCTAPVVPVATGISTGTGTATSSVGPGEAAANQPQGTDPSLDAPRLDMVHSATIAFVVFCLCATAFAFLVVAALNGWKGIFRGAFLQPMLVLDPSFEPKPSRRRVAVELVALAEVALLLLIVWVGIVALESWAIERQLESTVGWKFGAIGGWRIARMAALASALGATAFALARIAVGDRKDLQWDVPASAAVISASFGTMALLSLATVVFPVGADSTGVLRYWRTIHLFNLVSPLPMIGCLFAILLIAAGYWVRLIHVDAQLQGEHLGPPASADEEVRAFWDSVQMLRLRSFRPPYALTVAVLLAAVWTACNVRAPLDFNGGKAFFIPALATLVVLGCGFEVWHLIAMWTATKKVLCSVEVERLGSAFNELRQEIIASLGHGSGMRQPHKHVLSRLDELYKKSKEPRVETVDAPASLAQNRPATASERFLAMRVAVLSAYGVCRLRGVWFRLAACSILFVASMACYPVHPHKDVLVLCWLLVGTVAGTTVWVFVEMNRNVVLSTIAGTPPNQVTWTPEFVEKLVTVVGLPLLGVVTAAFPRVARIIGSLLEPILHGH